VSVLAAVVTSVLMHSSWRTARFLVRRAGNLVLGCFAKRPAQDCHQVPFRKYRKQLVPRVSIKTKKLNSR
jgi:hypothetical protein